MSETADVLRIGSERQLLWDDAIILRTRTETTPRLHMPIVQKRVRELPPLFSESAYFRAERARLAFPTRAVQRDGKTLTDTLFACACDGKTWTQYDEAFVRPGNRGYTLLPGMAQTPSDHPGCDDELSLFLRDESGEIWRASLRMDGFVSQRAPMSGVRLYTKPFLCEGDELFINFATSAAGGMFLRVICEDGRVLDTDELFGDSVNRRVRFRGEKPTGALHDFAGSVIQLRFTMWDADLYAFKLEKF